MSATSGAAGFPRHKIAPAARVVRLNSALGSTGTCCKRPEMKDFEEMSLSVSCMSLTLGVLATLCSFGGDCFIHILNPVGYSARVTLVNVFCWVCYYRWSATLCMVTGGLG